VEKELYDNEDYDELMNKFTKKEQLKKIQQKHIEKERARKPSYDNIRNNVMSKYLKGSSLRNHKNKDIFRIEKVSKKT
jgi:hypothetical protein